MSNPFGCVCYICKKWHSHIVEYGLVRENGKLKMKYICVNCNIKKRRENGNKKRS